MKNNYSIIDDYFIINIINRKKIEFSVLVDLEDLPKLLEFDVSWHIWIDKRGTPYVRCTEYLGIFDGKPKYKTYYLQRFICSSNGEEVIDHINNNTLDNRKKNLRVSFIKENTKNRKGKNGNNTSGYRNVSKVNNLWYVQMQIDGVNTCLKKFSLDEVHAAGAYAKLMRDKYYGNFAGKS